MKYYWYTSSSPASQPAHTSSHEAMTVFGESATQANIPDKKIYVLSRSYKLVGLVSMVFLSFKRTYIYKLTWYSRNYFKRS